MACRAPNIYYLALYRNIADPWPRGWAGLGWRWEEWEAVLCPDLRTKEIQENKERGLTGSRVSKF